MIHLLLILGLSMARAETSKLTKLRERAAAWLRVDRGAGDAALDIMRRKQLLAGRNSSEPIGTMLEYTRAEGLGWLMTHSSTEIPYHGGQLRHLREIYADLAVRFDPKALGRLAVVERWVDEADGGRLEHMLSASHRARREDRLGELIRIEKQEASRTGLPRPDIHEALDLVFVPSLIFDRAENNTLHPDGRQNPYDDGMKSRVLDDLRVSAPHRALVIWQTDKALEHLFDVSLSRILNVQLLPPDTPVRVRFGLTSDGSLLHMALNVNYARGYLGELDGAEEQISIIRKQIQFMKSSGLRDRASASLDRFAEALSRQRRDLRGDLMAHLSKNGLFETMPSVEWKGLDFLACEPNLERVSSPESPPN